MVNIATLGEEELLNMVHQLVASMVTFASNTRNVHKELKESLTKASKVMTRLKKIRDAKSHVLNDTSQLVHSEDYQQRIDPAIASERVTSETEWIKDRLDQQDCKLDKIMTFMFRQKERQHSSPTPKSQEKEHEEQVAPKQPKKINQPSTSGTPPTETAWTEVVKRGKRARSNNERREETEGLENANGSTTGQPANRNRWTRDEGAEDLVRR